MTIDKKQNRLSTSFAFMEVIPYALIPLIWLIKFPVPQGLSGNIAQAVIVTVAKDILSGVVYLLIMAFKGKIGTTFKLLKRKEGWYVVVAGIFGGPIGYVLFNAAFLYAGPSYGHIFTSVEPIILVVTGILLFKRKYNLKLILGIFLAVASISSLIIGDSFSNDKSVTKVVLGAILGIGGAAAWALETMLFDKAFSGMKGDKDATMKLLTLKMTSAILFGVVIMMPSMSALATSQANGWSTDAAMDYNLFFDLFKESKYIWRFFTAGVLIIVARFMYFYAIDRKGGTFVAVIYNLIVIATPIFSMIWFGIDGTWVGSEDLFSKSGIVLLSVAPFLLAGVTLVTLNAPKIERYEKVE